MTNKYLKITKGQHTLNKNLELQNDSDLTFKFGEHYLLTGGNGSGKTSFLNKLFLPELSKVANGKFLYFHSSQDVTLQLYFIKAYYRGLLNTNEKFSTSTETLNNLKNHFLKFENSPSENIVFVLDEIDQYLSMVDFFNGINLEKHSVVLVTHNSENLPSIIEFTNIIFQPVSHKLTKITIQ